MSLSAAERPAAGSEAVLPLHSTSDASGSLASPQGFTLGVDTYSKWSNVRKLDSELYSLVERVRPSRTSHRQRMNAVRSFEAIIRRDLWPASKVEVFGSLATGLYLPDGDLDVVVTLPPISTASTQAIFEDIAQRLQARGFVEPSSVEILPHARVPLLKLSTIPRFGSLKFDVTLSHARDGPLGATACLSILKGLDESGSTKADRAKGLIFAVKTLLQAKDLGTARDGSLGGMAIFCLVVAFVQHDLRAEKTCSPATDFLEFLHFAAYFDYEHFAISVIDGGSILPKVSRRWCDGAKPRRICIQHPTDLDRNLSIGTYKLSELETVFRETYEKIQRLLESDERTESYLDEIFSRDHDSNADIDAIFYSPTPSEEIAT